MMRESLKGKAPSDDGRREPFETTGEHGLSEALTRDHHFEQAGFRSCA
jgi:hypothetical protein